MWLIAEQIEKVIKEYMNKHIMNGCNEIDMWMIVDAVRMIVDSNMMLKKLVS